MVLVIYSRQWYKKNPMLESCTKGMMGGPSGTQRRGGMGKGQRMKGGVGVQHGQDWDISCNSTPLAAGHLQSVCAPSSQTMGLSGPCTGVTWPSPRPRLQDTFQFEPTTGRPPRVVGKLSCGAGVPAPCPSPVWGTSAPPVPGSCLASGCQDHPGRAREA